MRTIAPSIVTRAIQDYNSYQNTTVGRKQKMHTNGLEEEGVVVKIVLDKQEIPLAGSACPLHQDIQRSLPTI